MRNFLMMVLLLSFFHRSTLSVEDWIPSDLQEEINSFSSERKSMEVSFQTQMPVHVRCGYALFPGQSKLVEYVNQEVQDLVAIRFNGFLQDEIHSQEEWEDGTSLTYELFPVYQTPNLISIYGVDYQGRGCHGCTYYEGKTFWLKDASMLSLRLDDLFVPASAYRQFLIEYCEKQLKASGYGYYSSLPEMPPELHTDDLDIFVITDKGLTIIFRAYRIGGWADGPDALTIPWIYLKEYIQTDGPLKEIAASFPKK